MGSVPQSWEDVDVEVGSHWEQKLPVSRALRGHERAGASGKGMSPAAESHCPCLLLGACPSVPGSALRVNPR